MFVAIYWTGGSSDGSMVVYGPFATEAEAEAWIARQDNPTFLTVSAVFLPPPLEDATPGFVTLVSPGVQCVILATFNLTGGSDLFCYGGFTSEAAARAWIAKRPFPAGCQVETVEEAD